MIFCMKEILRTIVQWSKRLSDNQTTLFTKDMLIAIPKRMICMMIIHLPKMMLPGGEYEDVCMCTLFLYHWFCPTVFSMSKF